MQSLKSHFGLALQLCGLLFFTSIATADTYDVYLLAGQSNMDGRGLTANLKKADRAPVSNTIIYYRNPPHSSEGWKPLGPGFSIPPKYKGKIPSPKFGPELGFARAMHEKFPDRKFALIKGSKGGSSLRVDWNPGTKDKPETQGERYRFFIKTIASAKTELTKSGHKLQLRGMIWHQGESDSKSSKEKYQKRLVEFIRRIREDVGVADLPIVVGEVFDNGKRDSVREASQTVAKNGPKLGIASSKDLTCWDQGTHFDAASQILLGQRYAAEMLRLETSEPKSNPGKENSDKENTKTSETKKKPADKNDSKNGSKAARNKG